MAYNIRLTADAAADLEELYAYVFRQDSTVNADALLQHIESTIEKLTTSPNRGTYPTELLELGIREYREIFFKPYRIIYRVIGRTAYVYLIADGRRDMRTLLARRLLGA